MGWWDKILGNTPEVKPEQNDQIILAIFDKINNIFGNGQFVNAQMTNFISTLLTIVGSYLTCWIIYRGYQILWGRSNDNIKDFLWDAFLKAIFIAICMYPEEWLKLVTEALKEMREISVSKSSLENDLQLFWDIGFSLVKVMTAEKNLLNLYYDLCAVIVIVGVFIGVFAVLSIVVINTISFTVLLALAPFAFYCLIFGNFLKPIFKQWWNLTLACVLTFIFLKIFMSFGMDVARSLASLALNSPKTSYAKCAGYVVLAGLIIKFIASLITGVVEKLVGVSIEGSVKNAATGGMQTAGLALGGAAIAGKSAIKGQFQALGKAFGKADNSLKSFKLNKPKTPSGSSAKDTSNG